MKEVSTKSIVQFLDSPKVKPRGSAGDRIKGLLANPAQWAFQPFVWPETIKDVKGDPMGVSEFEHNCWPVGDGGIMILFPGEKRLGAYCETLHESRSKGGLAIRCSQSHKGQPHKFDMPIGTQDRCFLLAGNFVLMDAKSLNRIEHVSQGEVKKVAQQVESVLQAFNRWQAQVNSHEEQSASIRLRIERITQELAGLDHKERKLEAKMERMEARSTKLNSSPATMATRAAKASSFNQAQAAVEDARDAGERTLEKLHKKLDELSKPIPMPTQLAAIVKAG